MNRIVVLSLLSLALFCPLLHSQAPSGKKAARSNGPPFSVVEATIPEMRSAMERGQITSRELVSQYLLRIALYNDKLHAEMTVNPRALKDNIHTTNMPTTGGALAFDGFVPPYEATLTKNLLNVSVAPFPACYSLNRFT